MFAAGAAAALLVWLLRRRVFDRDSLRRRAELAAGLTPLQWLVLAFAAWWSWALVGQTLASIVPGARDPDRPLAGLAVSLGAYGAGLGVMAALAACWFAPLRRAGLRAGPGDPIPAGVASALGFPIILAVSAAAFLAATMLAELTGAGAGADRPRLAPKRARAARGRLARARVGVLAIQAVVLAPIFEELVYRLCLHSALVAAFRRTWPAVVLSSGIFALVHLASVPLHALPVLFAVGALCAVVFERTGRIGPAILVHAAFNALNLGFVLLRVAAPEA